MDDGGRAFHAGHAGHSASLQQLLSSLPSVSPRTSSLNFKNAQNSRSVASFSSSSPPPPLLRPRASRGTEGHYSMRPRAPDPRDAGDLLNPAEESPEDIRHSHGLSWSSVTHDDVVDNLLFSLDNFSRGHVAPEPRDWRSDSQQDEFLNSLTARSVRPMEATAPAAAPNPRAPRSTSNAPRSNRLTAGSPPRARVGGAIAARRNTPRGASIPVSGRCAHMGHRGPAWTGQDTRTSTATPAVRISTTDLPWTAPDRPGRIRRGVRSAWTTCRPNLVATCHPACTTGAARWLP
jgi:hypothetical protein